MSRRALSATDLVLAGGFRWIPPTVTAASAAGLGLLIMGVPVLPLIMVLGALAFLTLILLRPDLGILLLLALRSTVDGLTEHRFQISSFSYVNISGAMALSIVFVAMALIGMRKIKLFSSRVEAPYSAFLLYWLAGLLFSVDRLVTVQEWFRVCAPFALYLLSLHLLVSKGREREVNNSLILSAVLPVVVGMYQCVTGSHVLLDDRHAHELAWASETLTFERIPGTFAFPMAFGFYIVTLLPLVFLEWRHARGQRKRGLLGVLMLAMLSMLVVTYTRGAWLGFLVTLIVFGALRERRLLAVPPILAAVALVCPALLGPVYNRWVDIFDPQLSLTSTFTTRLSLWMTALSELFPAQPILGHGLGSFPLVYGEVRWYEAAHNDYLRVLIEGGVVGLLLYLWLLGTVVAVGWRAWQAAEDGRSKDLAAAFLAVVCGYLVIQLSDNLFGMPVVQFYFWTFVALMAREGVRSSAGVEHQASPA